MAQPASASQQAGAAQQPSSNLSKNFKVVKFLGKGSYGAVYLVQRVSDGQEYALKELDVKTMSPDEKKDAVNEIRLLASAQHPNIIRYHEAISDGNKLYIIMEYAPAGDLSKKLKTYQAHKKPMPEDVIWKLFIQVAAGLNCLHQMKILHRDIKPGNIMVSENDVVKIGDLGIAKVLKVAMTNTQIGTPHYMSPEIWKNQPYGFTSDTWALGCALFEMATFTVPFEARSMQELRFKVLKGVYPPVPQHYSADLQEMVRCCLRLEPERRPTMEQILCSRAVQSRLHLLPQEVVSGYRRPTSQAQSLLDTIQVPRDLRALQQRLPDAQYSSGSGEGGSQSRLAAPAGPKPSPLAPSAPAAAARPAAPAAPAAVPVAAARPSSAQDGSKPVRPVAPARIPAPVAAAPGMNRPPSSAAAGAAPSRAAGAVPSRGYAPAPGAIAAPSAAHMAQVAGFKAPGAAALAGRTPALPSKAIGSAPSAAGGLLAPKQYLPSQAAGAGGGRIGATPSSAHPR